MKPSKWEEGYLLIDAIVGLLILSLFLGSLSGLYSSQIKASEEKSREAASFLSARAVFLDKLEYEF